MTCKRQLTLIMYTDTSIKALLPALNLFRPSTTTLLSLLYNVGTFEYKFLRTVTTLKDKHAGGKEYVEDARINYDFRRVA